MKKGFTLVELLSVIAIISILTLLIVPKVNETIINSKKNVNRNSVSGVVKAADVYYTKHLSDKPSDYGFDGVTNIYSNLKVKGSEPDSALVRIKKTGEVEVRILFGKTCYVKGFSTKKITEGDISLCEDNTVLLPGES